MQFIAIFEGIAYNALPMFLMFLASLSLTLTAEFVHAMKPIDCVKVIQSQIQNDRQSDTSLPTYGDQTLDIGPEKAAYNLSYTGKNPISANQILEIIRTAETTGVQIDIRNTNTFNNTHDLFVVVIGSGLNVQDFHNRMIAPLENKGMSLQLFAAHLIYNFKMNNVLSIPEALDVSASRQTFQLQFSELRTISYAKFKRVETLNTSIFKVGSKLQLSQDKPFIAVMGKDRKSIISVALHPTLVESGSTEALIQAYEVSAGRPATREEQNLLEKLKKFGPQNNIPLEQPVRIYALADFRELRTKEKAAGKVGGTWYVFNNLNIEGIAAKVIPRKNTATNVAADFYLVPILNR